MPAAKGNEYEVSPQKCGPAPNGALAAALWHRLVYMQPVFARVAVPVPLGKAFSYFVPVALRQSIAPGARVLCEFGRRKILGVVLGLDVQAPTDLDQRKIKPLLGLVDGEPALPMELLSFLEALAAYYAAPVGEVMRLALPAVERGQVAADQSRLFGEAKVQVVGRLIQVAAPVVASAEVNQGDLPRGQAREIWTRLCESGPTPIKTLESEFPSARSALKRLAALGLVALEKRSVEALEGALDIERDTKKVLNEAQLAAVSVITQAMNDKPRAFLLDGITGSGKTEVYLHVVDQCLTAGRGAIVLVPEIALTPQLVGRFRARFGDRIAVLHSAMTEKARHRMWKRLRSGEFRVAVGARSALFAPVLDLALVCVDEEHDSSFKQEEGVRYHARDMALLRAHRAGACCVLGSATPSIGSEALVRKDKLQRLVLPERATRAARLPTIEVVNLNRVGAGPSGHRLLSLTLHRELEFTLQMGKQAILFLNRRGFAPSVLCSSCGEIVRCPNCAVALTAHRHGGELLRCHYCDFVSPPASECTKCHGRDFSQEGAGTERIEQALKAAFPTARVARLDRDVAEGIKSEPVLDAVRRGEIDILVGTQMVTKGHDLPNVVLVGVLNADGALSLPDYQASERTFQLIVQVAGRAGRGDTPGRVLIQTRQPEHPAIRFALAHDTKGFVAHELRERRDAGYPPFSRLLMIRVDSLDDSLARRTIADAAGLARKLVGTAAEVMGPAPAPLERLRNRFRHRFMVRADGRAPLYQVAYAVSQMKIDRRVRLHVDMDPLSML